MKMICLTLFLVATAAFGASGAETKTGLVKEKGTYYYYSSKGVKVTGKWKTIGGHTYYFGKNGAACRAAATPDKTYNFRIFTINGKKYGFDAKARRVSGILVNQRGKLYYFSKKGVYKPEKSKKLRKVVKKGMRPENLIELIQASFGKAKKVKWSPTGESCDGWNEDKFTDVSVFYPHFEIVMVRHDATGQMRLSYCMPTK